MGISLDEYAAAHPGQRPEAEQARIDDTANAIQERQQNRAEAAELKQNILSLLENGTEPQIALYAAIKCIGLYSGDKSFTEQATRSLEAVYADLMQQSILMDTSATAAARIEEKQAEHKDKLRRSIDRQLKENRRIEKELTGILAALNGEAIDQESEEDIL